MTENLLIQMGWMVVVCVVVIALVRFGTAMVTDNQVLSRPAGELVQLQRVAEQLAQWPEPEELIGRMDALDERLKELESTGTTIPAVVSRANEITKDMLEVKRLVANHEELLIAIRSKASLGSAFGGRVGG